MNHPLFPNAPEDDKREIAWINVTRFERSGHIWYPRAFKAEELQGLDDIAGMFGGGSYELIARQASSKTGGIGFIIDRVRVTLPGEPIPFDAKDDDAASAPAPMPAMHVPQGGSDMQALVIAVLQMQQASQAQQTQLMATMFNSSSQQTAAIVTALAGRQDGGGSAELIRAMGDMQRAHTEAMAKLYEARGGGGGGGGDGSPMDALVQGMELGQAMKGEKEPSDLALVIQGMTALAHAPTPANAPANAPAMPAKANGSSSS